MIGVREGSGDNSFNIKSIGTGNYSVEEVTENAGYVINNVGKENVVGVPLSECAEKLHAVETSLWVTRDLRRKRVNELKIRYKQLRALRNEITSERKSIKELNKKERLLCKERNRLKKKRPNAMNL